MDAQPSPPQQKFSTEGVAPMQRPGAITRLFMAVVRWAERLNLKYAVNGNPPVYGTATFPWAAEIEDAYPGIRAELEKVLLRKADLPNFQDISSDVQTITRDAGWKTFFLVGFGKPSERNIALCPKTWEAVQKIPGLKTAMFSIFEPGKHLPAHRGPYNGVLRLHLGLIVPIAERDQIAIRVDKQVCHWDEGKVLIFDDAYEHEAWNHSDKTRVVLFVDFVKPTRFPASFVNWLLMNLAVFTPFVQEGMEKHKAWEEAFHAAKK
jgi:ornithine lipid ester-linked acyl 2-hydroxylase